eukprot:1154684-Pelagomonas_calceolata.AAC.2
MLVQILEQIRGDTKRSTIQWLQWGLTFSQVVGLLGLLNCSDCTKNIHEFENKAIRILIIKKDGGSLAQAERACN